MVEYAFISSFMLIVAQAAQTLLFVDISTYALMYLLKFIKTNGAVFLNVPFDVAFEFLLAHIHLPWYIYIFIYIHRSTNIATNIAPHECIIFYIIINIQKVRTEWCARL